MYQKERLDKILELLEQNGYLTVRYLTENLHYSTATVNRDLNALVQMKKVKRTYGGVEAIREQAVPLTFRYEKEKTVKKRLCRAAAALVSDGQTVFIDGSSTTQYMGEYLLGKKNLHVITNNLSLAIFLSENGIRVTVLGGRIVEEPCMTDGADTVAQAMKYRADLAFFSVGGFDEDGTVGCSDECYFLLHRVMQTNSREMILLADHEKLDVRTPCVLFDFSVLSAVISDHVFPESTLQKFPSVRFLRA